MPRGWWVASARPRTARCTRSRLGAGPAQTCCSRTPTSAPRRVSLRELADLGSTADLSSTADLVVLSGCSTQVCGPQDGEGLYGIAPTAALAGVSAVSASLWPVRRSGDADVSDDSVRRHC
ncbi:CHAT domain-containing protein [Microbacterium arthrosphaerae]|uniref:CHAT domain-containing protein n=1 Tax=Microbacterium TaxID=33882 RepID=UPI0035E84560